MPNVIGCVCSSQIVITILVASASGLQAGEASRYSKVCQNCESCNLCDGLSIDIPICYDALPNTKSNGGEVTLETLELDKDYWRVSAHSKTVLPCYTEDACLGGTQAPKNIALKATLGHVSLAHSPVLGEAHTARTDVYWHERVMWEEYVMWKSECESIGHE